MWLVIHAGIKLKPCLWKEPQGETQVLRDVTQDSESASVVTSQDGSWYRGRECYK